MNPDQFKNLYYEMFPLLWRYSWKITKDKDESEDIATQSLIGVWDKLSDFNSDLEVKKYAYTIAKNASINFIQKQKTKNKYITHLGQTVSYDPNEIEIITYQAALLDRVHHEIENLPPKCKQIFKLCYIHNKSRNETAEILNLSTDTVNTQCQIALKKLRIFLDT
jgi:RNA polymerase sigma-70 factor (ECF subfamily)